MLWRLPEFTAGQAGYVEMLEIGVLIALVGCVDATRIEQCTKKDGTPVPEWEIEFDFFKKLLFEKLGLLQGSHTLRGKVNED